MAGESPKPGGMRRRRSIWTAAAIVFIIAGGGLIWALTSNDAAGCPVEGPVYADAKDPALVSLGRRVYADNCAACHGAGLEGQPNWRKRLPDGTLPAPPHDETGHTWHHPDRLLYQITKCSGGYNAPKNFKSAMPGFGDTLDDREILAVLAFIKSRWPEPVRQRQDIISKQNP